MNEYKMIMPETIITDMITDMIETVESACTESLLYKLKQEHVSKKFQTEVQGYHLICEAPIKEALWEEINKNIAACVCEIKDEAKGNHKSGKDMQFDEFGISMKSAKLDKNKLSISSYRLTTVCSDKNPGDLAEIVKEISQRDSSFQYYSILLREELDHNILQYNWCLIPKSCPLFNISETELKPKFGKTGKNKGVQVGWETKYASITFSMSSQLWIHFTFDDIKPYIISSIKVNNSQKKISYTDIFNIKTCFNP
jgi:hypothetical protein